MAYEEVNVGEEMYKFELNKPIEGKLKEVKEDIGANKSKVYYVGDYTFWGTSSLDLMMSSVKEGDQVRITLTDENFKFPSGRSGKNFKVEIDK